MSEPMDNTREQIWQILHNHKKQDEWSAVVLEILSIPEIAVVDRKAKLPTKYGEGMSTTAKTGYKMAHAELPKEGWIKEVKD